MNLNASHALRQACRAAPPVPCCGQRCCGIERIIMMITDAGSHLASVAVGVHPMHSGWLGNLNLEGRVTNLKPGSGPEPQAQAGRLQAFKLVT